MNYKTRSNDALADWSRTSTVKKILIKNKWVNCHATPLAIRWWTTGAPVG